MLDEKSPLLDKYGKPIRAANDKHYWSNIKPRVIVVSMAAGLAVLTGIIANLRSIHEFMCSSTVIECQSAQERKLDQAIKRLNDDNMDKRVDAIRSLNQIAKDNNKFYPEILQRLAALVRSRAPWRPNHIRTAIQPDIQEALATIASIPKVDHRGIPIRVDLHNIDISGALLEGADLEGVVLWGSNLRKTRLASANLKNADLGGVDLTEASLEKANLEGAKLWFSPYDEPRRVTILRGALLAGAILKDANLEKANMADARDVTVQQLKQAIINDNTILPTYIQKSALNK
jgi:hypothetical protein